MMPTRWYSNLSLRTKATAIGLAITIVSLVVVATTGILQIRSQIDAEQHRSADSLAMGFARASELALAVRDKRELTRLSTSFLRDENILFVAVFGTAEQALAAAVRDPVAWDAYRHGKVDPNRCLIGQRNVQASEQGNEFGSELETDSFGIGDSPKPAPAKPAEIGRVILGMSTAPSILAQRRQSRMTIITTVVSAGAGGLLLFVTLGAWMRRLQRIADASGLMSRGEFDSQIGDTHDDEIGRLARSFDAMRLAVRERDQQLRTFADTLQDQVTQRTKDLQTALAVAEEANRAKSLFLANMSHELRTPLNGVIGMVDLLLNAQPSPQQRRYCDVAKSSARSLLELINDILDFSKIEAGKLELDSTDFSLHEVVEGVAQMLGERAQNKGVELACRIGTGVPQAVTGDPMRLRQVVMNLISNAIKFTERGAVALSAELQSETQNYAIVKFAVRDSGIGIPPERISRLFKSFSQVDASTTRKFGGTGLGLAISQRIVELMGGEIGVESELGKGSTFWFTARFEKRVRPPVARRDGMVDPRGLRALAVDDNQTNREILHAQLASWSLRADMAESGKQAMEMLRAAVGAGEPYRFAILDIQMPDQNGMQLAQEIKSDPATRDVILISLSSLGDRVKPAEMQQAGFAASLTKPALPSNLYDAIVDSLSSDPRTDLASANAPAAVLHPQSLTRIRVLLAEDNEVNRLVASELLMQAGCSCAMAMNGREAVEMALATDANYDVILMDCQMPELDGFEATGAIRKAERHAGGAVHRPIIALTANAIKGDREKCLEAGMDAYVTKPIEPETLFLAIQRALSPQRVAQAVEAGAAQALQMAAGVGAVNTPGKLPEAPGSFEQPPIDIESLRKRCLGNRKLAVKALGKFESTVVLDVQLLLASVGRGDAKAAASSAHKIKGAAGNVSAEGVRRIAGELEQLAKDDALSQAQSQLEQLQREVERVREYVASSSSEAAPVPAVPMQSAGTLPRPE